MARRRFFVPEIHAGRARISGDDAHHLTRVLRVEAGQKFEISDNRQVCLAEVETAHKCVVDFAVLERLPVEEPALHVTLYAPLIRFERFELLIEKATELGVAAIAPFAAERSEKGLEQAAAKRAPRWLRIAREASEQARRDRLPEIGAAVRFEAALAHGGELRYALDEAEAPPILSALPPVRRAGAGIALLAGPEGGWTDRERTAINGAGWRRVSLGKTILKTETAILAALAILNAAWDRPPI
jgi:16S rRNA (uracil1498-N3)-methyltransferase